MKHKIVICSEPYDIGFDMKGMGYRYWNLALFLFKFNMQVTIIVDSIDNEWDAKGIKFIEKREYLRVKHVRNEKVIVNLETDCDLINFFKVNGNKIIFDNILTPFESFFFQKNIDQGDYARLGAVKNRIEKIKKLIILSDFYISGTEEEKFFTLGQIVVLKNITVENITELSTRNCVIPTPFIATSMIKHSNDPIFNKIKNVFLWNGGLWNHYDLGFLIQAFRNINKKSKGLIMMKFMYKNNTSLFNHIKKEALKYKFIDVPKYFARKTKQAAKEKEKILISSRALILLNENTIQNELVLPLRMRESLLYIKPMIVSESGILARYVKENRIGVVVGNNEEDLVMAIEELLDDKRYDFYCKNILNFREKFLIENNADNLISYINCEK